MPSLDERVRLAHADAWQAEGRLRVRPGGGAAEFAGARLMASGLAHPQWNSGDLVDVAAFDLAATRAWYAARAHGAGVPWGIRVPAGMEFPHGRFLFATRNMALRPESFRPIGVPGGVVIAEASESDLTALARIDAEAFDEPVDSVTPWIAPHLGARDVTVLLARLDGQPVGAATAIHTDDRAGRCAGIFGVGVVAHARGRGIGAALTAWLVERAFARGATLAHLNPNTDAAARVYARLGFVETAGFDIYVDL